MFKNAATSPCTSLMTYTKNQQSLRILLVYCIETTTYLSILYIYNTGLGCYEKEVLGMISDNLASTEFYGF
jgi:hypothetical protein